MKYELCINDVTIEILIYDDSYSVSHVETPSPEYSLQTPNCSPIASTIPETQEIINNMVNDFSFTEVPSLDPSPVPSPEYKLQASSYNPLAFPVSKHIVVHLQSPTVLKSELFLDNIEKEKKIVTIKNNII